MDRLLPCPHCKGVARLTAKDAVFGGHNAVTGRGRRKYRIQAICNRCKSRGKPVLTDWTEDGIWEPSARAYGHYAMQVRTDGFFAPYAAKATAAWNRRAQPENKPPTCEGCVDFNATDDDYVRCGECKRLVRTTDCYRHPPKEEPYA